MIRLWQPVLLKELLLVGLGLLLGLKLLIDDLLQLGLELDLHHAYLRGYNVPQFLFNWDLVLKGVQ